MDTTPGKLLERQHRDIDKGIKALIDGGADMAALAGSLELLRLHLYLEEEILFPVLEQHGITMPIFVMKREHGQMWPLLQQLADAVARKVGASGIRDDCDELFKLLQIHNTKEEQIVYSAADRLASNGEEEAMTATLDAVVDVPDDWKCSMAPR